MQARLRLLKFFTKKESLDGKCVEIRKPQYRDIFDLSTAIDKLIASSAFNGNEIRDAVGYDRTDEEIHNTYFITKNYSKADEALEGGDDD